MALNQKQFEFLAYLESHPYCSFTQRSLAKELAMSVGLINQLINEAIQVQWIFKEDLRYHVSSLGKAVLEPYRVQRAILFADHFDPRFMALTTHIPKAMLKVQGLPLLQRIIDAVLAQGIENIIVVRGYNGASLQALAQCYPTLSFVDNPLALDAGSMTSLYCVKEYLANALLIHGDVFLYDPSILRKYEYMSCVGGIRADWCDDYCFHTRKGYIQRMEKGGRNVYQMVALSYWDKEAAKCLKEDLEMMFQMPGGKHYAWEELVFQRNLSHYQIQLKYIANHAIFNINSIQDLQHIDPSYLHQ